MHGSGPCQAKIYVWFKILTLLGGSFRFGMRVAGSKLWVEADLGLWLPVRREYGAVDTQEEEL